MYTLFVCYMEKYTVMDCLVLRHHKLSGLSKVISQGRLYTGYIIDQYKSFLQFFFHGDMLLEGHICLGAVGVLYSTL